MERVELSLHTNMTKMRGFIKIKDYIYKALEYGMTAIAITDYENVQGFPDAIRCLDSIECNRIKVIYGMETNIKLKDKIFHATILVKNEKGLINLYKLISFSYLEYFDKKPIIPFVVYEKYSEGLIIGACFNDGELYDSISNEMTDDELCDIANKYDYLEVCPVKNENKKDIVKKIIDIGNKLNKTVVATGNVYYIEPKENLYYDILTYARNEDTEKVEVLNYFRTTEEMLAEFKYLGDEKAYEIVVTNTNKIVSMCKSIQPIPKEKCYPDIDNSENEIKELSYQGAYKIYGNILPKKIQSRLEKELELIIENGYASLYIIAQRLVKKANEDGYIVSTRGAIGSSLVAYCLGITEVNSIKYNIPFETLAGFNGEREPDIDLNFAEEYQRKAQESLKDIINGVAIFYCGTVGTLSEKTAYNYTDNYFKKMNIEYDEIEIECISKKIVGSKRKVGCHPGGIMIVPKGREIYEYTPIQHPETTSDMNVISTHFDYHSIDGILLKLDILAHADLSVLYRLKELTGINPRNIPMDDEKTMNLIKNADTSGIAEFCTDFVKDIILKTKPSNFEELVKISGLSHGTYVWIDNAQELIKNGTTTLNEVIACRDDIMNYLIEHGIERKTAFCIMETVRKGKPERDKEPKWEEYKEIMKKHNVPNWYIKSCEKIRYLFPRAHAINYVMNSFRLAYYKAHYPKKFYQAYIEIRVNKELDVVIPNDKKEILKAIEELNEKIIKNENIFDFYSYSLKEAYELALEMNQKGIQINS